LRPLSSDEVARELDAALARSAGKRDRLTTATADTAQRTAYRAQPKQAGEFPIPTQQWKPVLSCASK
jgi:hypothetical protein